MKVGAIVALVAVVAVGLGSLLMLGNLIEILDSGHIMVIQYPRGELRVAVEPGPYAQWGGTVTKYQKRDQFIFPCPKDKDDPDISLPITFNDGGRGKVCGEIAWEMPLDAKNVIALHVRYRSHEAIETQLVRPVIAKTVSFTGPLMSSTESYAARKNEILFSLEDQITNGVYKTESQQIRVKDPMTGIDKTVTQVNLVRGEKGVILRQDNSPLDDFGIRTFNLVVKDIVYDVAVTEQIRQQQQAFAQVQTAVARAKEAEQNAITVAKQGEALAAEAKWKQEVLKAQAVTEAEQKLRVAQLDAETAAQRKREKILLGEGEAQARQLVMTADGALERKLQTYLEREKIWAGAFQNFKGNIVPQIQMGSTSAPGSNAALSFIELMGLKAAKDLALDMEMKGTANKK